MLHRPVESKVCPLCNVDKPASEYSSDQSRIDGIKFCCKECFPNYVPNRSKKSFDGTVKECVSCHRELPARAFGYAQYNEDRLSQKCRTCLQRRGKPAPLEEILEFELAMQNIYDKAVLHLIDKYDLPYETVIVKHRGEFEELIFKAMNRQGLLRLWKLPIWLSKKILPT